MAATEQLFNVRERKRFERHDIWERIAENGTHPRGGQVGPG